MFREMARKNQQLDPAQIVELLKSEKRGVLSIHGENGYPYGVPINFWYNEENGYLYFHSGQTGHKVDALKADARVSFCVHDAGYRNAGEWALNIRSVIVFGTIHTVDDPKKAMAAFRQLSLKFTSDTDYIESEIADSAAATLCYELRPEHVTGKIVNES